MEQDYAIGILDQLKVMGGYSTYVAVGSQGYSMNTGGTLYNATGIGWVPRICNIKYSSK